MKNILIVFDHFTFSGYMNSFISDSHMLSLIKYIIPTVKVGYIDDAFWEKVDYSVAFKEWLVSEQLIDENGYCLLESVKDLQKYANQETLYISLLEEGSGYYFKLMEDPEFLKSESTLYFDLFFILLNQEKSCYCIDLTQLTLLMRRLSVEFEF